MEYFGKPKDQLDMEDGFYISNPPEDHMRLIFRVKDKKLYSLMSQSSGKVWMPSQPGSYWFLRAHTLTKLSAEEILNKIPFAL